MPANYIQGDSGVIAGVDLTHQALRVTTRPLDVGVGGSYGILVSSGTMAAGIGGASEILQFRWTSSQFAALIRSVRIAMMSLGTGFTAGTGFIDMVAARAWSTDGSGGGTATLTGSNQKRRTGFATSLAAIRTATTAALGAGTKALDAQALGGLRFGVTTAINTVMQPTAPIWQPDNENEWPLVLGNQEGFSLRVTVPATGTWQFDAAIEWDEVAGF